MPAILLPVIEPPRTRARGYAGGGALGGAALFSVTVAAAVSLAASVAAATAPAAPAGPSHPLAGTGLTWVYAEDVAKLFTDVAGTTPAAGTEGEVIKRRAPAEGSLWAYQSNGNNNYKHGKGDGAHAINGKPVLYISGVDGFAGGMNTNATAAAMITAKSFDYFMVVRRVDTDDNQTVCLCGANRPFTVRQYTTGARAYGSLGGFVQTAINTAFNVGAHVVHVRFDNTAGDKKLKLAIDGGAFVTVAEIADWSPDAGALSLGEADLDIACEALSDGLYADYATLVDDLKTYYAI